MASAETALVEKFVAEVAHDRSRLLDIAHAVQRQFGCIDDAAVRAIAAGLGMQALGIAIEETSADGAFTLGWTSDIGMADQG